MKERVLRKAMFSALLCWNDYVVNQVVPIKMHEFVEQAPVAMNTQKRKNNTSSNSVMVQRIPIHVQTCTAKDFASKGRRLGPLSTRTSLMKGKKTQNNSMELDEKITTP